MHMPTLQNFDLQNVKLLYQAIVISIEEIDFHQKNLFESIIFLLYAGGLSYSYFFFKLFFENKSRRLEICEQEDQIAFCFHSICHECVRSSTRDRSVTLFRNLSLSLGSLLIYHFRYLLSAHIASNFLAHDSKFMSSLRQTYQVRNISTFNALDKFYYSFCLFLRILSETANRPGKGRIRKNTADSYKYLTGLFFIP